MHQIMTPAQRGRWITEAHEAAAYRAELERLDRVMETAIDDAGKMRDGSAWLLREFQEMYGTAYYDAGMRLWTFPVPVHLTVAELRRRLATFPLPYTIV